MPEAIRAAWLHGFGAATLDISGCAQKASNAFSISMVGGWERVRECTNAHSGASSPYLFASALFANPYSTVAVTYHCAFTLPLRPPPHVALRICPCYIACLMVSSRGRSNRGARASAAAAAAAAQPSTRAANDKPVFSSLSDRFQQITQQRVASSTTQPRRLQTMKAQSTVGLRLSPQAQAQLQQYQQQDALRNVSGAGAGTRTRGSTRGNARGRGARGRGRGRGGNRNASRPKTKEDLDRDLDNYLMQNGERARAKLDEDLDSYMTDVQAEGNATA
ncbi:hypothetical protein THASP1DRAFT_21500 [Thamnocephalis sphaerospora]|uniref:Chromatin target of PRMT1 protein C-terminal domain-containing protein n=1 Tax=Thamnocephalis sphaerospora TaxID=78915 RepID=A0A4P9XWW8_9FUNG|nr:hypothetical protein THASP1DRAFT_21500 [Thamnocephalis sphaerospora]|eukprot:RKP10836.1 hypothetical protein THASP1DRAFT_21500 [Thamnocephalis sphaerospora]